MSGQQNIGARPVYGRHTKTQHFIIILRRNNAATDDNDVFGPLLLQSFNDLRNQCFVSCRLG